MIYLVASMKTLVDDNRPFDDHDIVFFGLHHASHPIQLVCLCTREVKNDCSSCPGRLWISTSRPR
jgi:hypothetical protein